VKVVPARLEPRFVERIWGARSLAPLFPEKTNLGRPVGEVWMSGEDCCFASGPFAGQRLGDAWAAMTPAWTGTRLAERSRFPLLVKFLFPEEKLSIQVHPGDDYARRHEASRGGCGKTEMWYVLAARPGAEVLVGLKPEVTAESFFRAVNAGTVENLLERIPLKGGAAVFVPAGTVHAIGPGCVLCEIQQPSDITYRVFDYNRLTAAGAPRELHVRQAMEVINFGEPSGGRVAPVVIERGPVRETYFIACRYFATEKWEFAARIASVTSGEHFDLLIFIGGWGRLTSAGETAQYAPGQVWLLPAALGAYQLEPASQTTLLRTYVPDIVNDFVRRLTDQRVEESAWSRLVYP